jgi:lipoprotein-anchoring transpeptidase ErfK/SrfK
MSESESPRPRRNRRRIMFAVLAVIVPVVPIVIALSLTGASVHTATAARAQPRTSPYTPVVRTHAPPTVHHASKTALPGGAGALVGYLLAPEALRSAPGGGGHTIGRLTTKTSFGSAETVLVRRVKGHWLGVVNVAVGNNRLGWIPSAHVQLTRVDWQLHAILSRHELFVYHDGRVVRHYVIATGRPTAPTPTGTFAVTDKLNTGDPGGSYGCCILALSAKAPHAIQDWSGGNRIAVHSTPDTGTIGQSISHGCMHVTLPEGDWLIHHVPLGTPAVVSTA